MKYNPTVTGYHGNQKKKRGLKIRYQTNLRARTSFAAIRQNGLQVLILGPGWYLSCLQHSASSYKWASHTGHTGFTNLQSCSVLSHHIHTQSICLTEV